MADEVRFEGGARYLKPRSAARKMDRGLSWLWGKVKDDPTFPRPLYIDRKSPLFLESELDAWIAARAAAARARA